MIPSMHDLATLVAGLPGARLLGNGATLVRAVHGDSRQVQPGDLFVAVRGRRADGHDFVPAVIERGAAAVVVERELPGLTVPQVVVSDTSRVLGVLIGRSFG